MTSRPFGIWRSNFPNRPRWFATQKARDEAFDWLATEGRFEFRKITRSLVACDRCGGDTIPPDPNHVHEIGHYCESCGEITPDR